MVKEMFVLFVARKKWSSILLKRYSEKMMKICSKCHKEKELIEFYDNYRYNDGKCRQCKECIRKNKREYYLLNKYQILRKNKKYIKNLPWKRIFNNIKTRCNNPKSKDYKDYGLRGIKWE
jgi:hypothetical protein